ncbi:MAG: ribosomal protein S27AE [Polyangiales bacterium]|jgi:ribosomal protein S27AE
MLLSGFVSHVSILPAMRVSLLLIRLLACAGLSLVFSAEAVAQSYAGEWRAGPLQVRNVTRSWGADCPRRLPASQTEGGGAVQVAQSGDHLTLSGSVRGNTRSCWSDNPNLRRISSRYQDGAWTIICRTPENDARAETARYSFNASSSTQIAFRETTEWDWTLNESRCQVTRTATRTFTRADGLAAEPEPDPEPPSVMEEAPRPQCTPGAPAGVRLSPARSQANVGQRVCFSTRVVDAAGCTVRGQRVSLQLQPPEGVEAALNGRCFEPRALGVYRVVATSASFSARASLEVTTNDLSDLVAQRDGTGPLDSNGQAEGEGSSGVEASALGSTSPPLYGGLGVLAALLLGGILLLVSRKKKPVSISEEYGVPATGSAAGPAAYVPPPKPPKVCPRCAHEERGDGSVCPNDGVALIDLNDETIRLRGKICPKCRTGHAAGTALCPNDETPLIYHVLYEAQQKELSAKKNVCAKCGNSYDAGVGFCPEDGTRLG